MQNGTAILEDGMTVTQKIKNRTTMWSRNLTSGYLSKITETRISNTYKHSYVPCSTIHNSQDVGTL